MQKRLCHTTFMGKIYIGTSGWSYDWKNFYPKELPKKQQLPFFAAHFPTVEINYSFYRLPSISSFKKWKEETPDYFLFALKLSRYITHIKRLKGVKAACNKFVTRAEKLSSKLGPILVQLPDNFHCDLARLERFLESIKEKKLKLAFEFRHESWYSKEIIALLRSYKAAMVFSHAKEFPYPKDEPVTANFSYLRLHGPKRVYGSLYGKSNLKKWADKIQKWKRKGDVFVYFNNDMHGYAVKDAKTLALLLQK